MTIDWRVGGKGMGTVDLRALRGDEIVLHYGGSLTTVDAYTFANSLIAFADTARAVNAIINPSQSIEVRLVAVGPGSYRAVVKWAAKELKGLFKEAPRQLFWIVVGGLLTKAMFADDPTQIVVNTSEVAIQRGDDRVIIPREAYEKVQQVEKSPEVRRQLKRTFDVLAKDESIENFGVTAELDDPVPLIQISRAEFGFFAADPIPEVMPEGRRSRTEAARLVILKAWLAPGKHKWSFEWNGVPISAPIEDEEFLERLANRTYLIGTGDALDVLLRFEQQYAPSLELYENDPKTYVIERVRRLIPRDPGSTREMFSSD